MIDSQIWSVGVGGGVRSRKRVWGAVGGGGGVLGRGSGRDQGRDMLSGGARSDVMVGHRGRTGGRGMGLIDILMSQCRRQVLWQ